MSEPIILRTQVGAWLSNPDYHVEFIDALASGNQKRASSLLLFSSADMRNSGWTLMGQAQVELALLPRDAQVRNAVGALNRQLQQERAESVQRQNAIMDRISKLQAITFDAEVA